MNWILGAPFLIGFYQVFVDLEPQTVIPKSHDLLVFPMHLLFFDMHCWCSVSLRWAFPGLNLPSILLETCVKIKTRRGIPNSNKAPTMLILLETSIQMQNFVIIDWLLYFAFLLQTSYKILCLLCSQTRSDKLQKHCFSWEVYWFSIIYQHFPLWIFSLLALAPPGLNFQIWPPLRNLSFS